MIYTDLIFVFAFLPITVILSLFDRSAEYKNLILVVSSLIFFTWGRPAIILLLFVTVIFDYIFGLGASKTQKSTRLISLLADILMNSAFFVVFARNYLFDKGGFFESLHQLSFADKLIPLGIAFYTVRGASYVFDVYKGRVEAEKNPFCLLTYMVSFHFMLAGPIVRYSDITGEIRGRIITAKEINDGLTRFVYGLGKAVILAPAFESMMVCGLDFESLTTFGAWSGMLGFLGYIYYGFGGFTDMALGLGLMNGFHYEENLLPLRIKDGVTGIVKSVNYSLTGFFREAVVYNGKSRVLYILSGLLCSAVVGLWYGFTKGCVCGALFLGAFVIAEKLFLGKILKKMPKAVLGAYTIIISLAGVCIFYFDSLWKFKKWVLACLGKGTSGFSNAAVSGAVKENFVLIIFGIALALPAVTDFVKAKADKASRRGGYPAVRILKTVCTAAVLFMYTVLSYSAL